MRSLLVASAFIVSSLVSGNINLGPAYGIKTPGVTDWKYVKKYTKDPVFVEGLEFSGDSTIIESAGGWSGSKIQLLEIDHTHKQSTSKRSQMLPHNYFGEGCTQFNGKVYMMTYTERKVFVYDPQTLK